MLVFLAGLPGQRFLTWAVIFTARMEKTPELLEIHGEVSRAQRTTTRKVYRRDVEPSLFHLDQP